MAREIKFRGKSVDDGKWVYGWVFGDKAKSIIEIDKEYPNEYGVEAYYTSVVIPETVGQYTGLKDKNGKEIYEGDILLHSFHSNYIQESLSSKQVVQWHEDCCGFGLVLKILAKSKNIEVIGNIYENPELLEVE